MKNLLLTYLKAILLFGATYFLSPVAVHAQIPTANNFSSQINYAGNYRYGVNQGYYDGWSSENTATIAAGNSNVNVKGVGVKSFRIPLNDDFLTFWGLTVEVGKFQAYAALGADDNVAFVGSPEASHRDPTYYPGSPEQSKVFKNLYDPIWLDAGQTQINPNNYYAKYLYDVVKTYGPYIKFWEVINEPDFTYSSAGWMGDQNPLPAGSWFDHNPTPEELVNLRAPIFSYIRMLRISWEVIKKLQPNDFVCVGGIGYRSFLDAVLRNSDNPADGSINSNFPLKGGAYFDMISFHSYPMYSLSVGNRHSDQATSAYIDLKNSMDNLAAKYGYNGSQYPRKQFICTETGVSRVMSGNTWGSNEGQKNYIMKASVLSQKNGIRQVYWFSLGDGTDGNNQHERMGLYYYFGWNTPYNQTPSDQGKALKTTSDLLYGKTYDAAKTAGLNLPANVDGAAFGATDGSYTYVLWAKTNTDLSETSNAVYSFPTAAITAANVVRKEWDYSETNTSTTVTKTNIQLTGTPSFFTETAGTNGNQNPVSNAGNDQTITLPTNTATLNGSGSDPDGSISSYAWTQISGPSAAGISSPSQGSTTVNNLVQGVYQFQLKVTDNLGAVATDIVQATVNATVSSPSSHIEAEDYTSMSGVVKENTSDAGGGQNVGYIDNGDWMEYNVNVSSAGTSTLNLRLASPSGGQLQIKNSAGTVLATVSIPNTGGYQNWQTISANIELSSGTQTIRIYSTSNGWNFNWMEIAGSATTPTNPTLSTRIEAENYNDMSGVVKENTSDAGGGQNVGYIDFGDWMDYIVNVPTAGAYAISLRLASPSGGQIQIKNSAGASLALVNIPNTGGYQAWQTAIVNVTLQAGTQTIRLYSSSNGWNFNWLEVTGSNAGGGGSASPLGSRIEAENYNLMSGVVKENTSDLGGGQNVGYIDYGDWMDYSVNVSSAGSYALNLRLSSPGGGQLQIKNESGTVLATVTIPNTAGYQNWQTVSANVVLTAGVQTIRVYSTSNGWNFNWMELGGGLESPGINPTTRIEAENYNDMSGVVKENTSDAGGGQNVGYIDYGDWMDYSVNSAGGTYAINLRVATPAGGQLQIKNSAGTVLATVSIPNTGGYQSWQTVSANISLAAGTQTIRVYSTSNGWNFNWLEVGGSSAAITSKAESATSVVGPIDSSLVVIYPNPIKSSMQLQVNNDLTGTLTVQVYDMQGRAQKQFALNKTNRGISRFSLSIGELATGNYIIKVTMNKWTQSKQIIKQ